MPIDVIWPTPTNPVGIIMIPKADTQLVSIGPPEIRSYDLNEFRGELGTLWASEDGAPYSKPFIHQQEVTISGYTYARGVIILPPYRVQFEDGQYVVQLYGANQNILDVISSNQVSVQSQNSAGLVNVLQLDIAAYDGSVWVNEVSGTPGQRIGYNGVQTSPVDNWTDAQAINAQLGLGNYRVLGTATLAAGTNLDGDGVVGSGPTRTFVTLSGASVVGTEFSELHLTGTLTGDFVARMCWINNIDSGHGFLYQCGIEVGSTVVLDGAGSVVILESWAIGGAATIDFNGAGSSLFVNGFRGSLLFTNKTGPEIVNVSADGFVVTIDTATVTSGTFVFLGAGSLVDLLGNPIVSSWAPGVILDVTGLQNQSTVAVAVWDELRVGHVTPGTFGESFTDMSISDTRVEEIWSLMGLNIAGSLVVSSTARSAPGVNQSVVEILGITSVTRLP
jgi:hypothetical protein